MPDSTREQQDLAGQVAWITGAARGIGAATAHALARRGVAVYLDDLRDCKPVAEAIVAAGGTATAGRLDITDRAACAERAARIVAGAGRLDILVANAGVCPPGEPAGDWQQWDQVLDVNLHGSQNCVAAVWAIMCERGAGCIVLVTSMAWYQGGLIVGTEYTASKAALVGMTRHLARNGGPLGIRCNAVAPGIIETDMTAEFAKPELEQIPLRRYGRAADVAGPISFLCGPESAYMTGTVLNITGGMVLAA